MIRLRDTRYQKTSDFLDSAVAIAEYYGFAPLEEIPRAQRQARKEPAKELVVNFARRDERTLPTAARKFLTCMKPIHGALLAWRIVPTNGAEPSTALELHVSGTSSAVAEALLIVIGTAIAREAGVTDHILSINNIGSAESSGRFVRDVGVYLRKHIETISPTLRPRAAEDPLGTLVQLIERGHPAAPRAPQSMEYLTEEERRRFWEFLEYLEENNLPYELNGQILGSRDCWSHSLFELSAIDSETGERAPFAFGGRYDPLASRVAQKPATGVMLSISCETRGATQPKRIQHTNPTIYFAHLGPEARRRSLTVLELLRNAAIPVHQGLWYERIGEQMSVAQDLGTPYVLIMGHKEAMDGTVIVREIATNSQEAIAIPQLATYLKRHRVVSPISVGARRS